MHSKDFYKALGLKQDASAEEITAAYRELSLRYHPDKTKVPGSEEKFHETAEAYDVLRDAERRAIYDQYGFDGLSEGAPKGQTEFTEGYAFHGDALKVFTDFFGTNNPYQDLFPPNDEFGLGGTGHRTRKTQSKAIENSLKVTLEEVYSGCIKKMKITRHVLNEDGHTTSMQDKILTVEVKPGWKEKTRVTFPKDGDQGPNHIPADVVFVLQYKEHPRFTRVGNDLVHKVTVPLVDALTGCIVELLMLDGRKLNIPVNDVVAPGHKVRVPGEGMPLTKTPQKKGDLILEFDVKFPGNLNQAQKTMLRQALA